MYSHRWIWSIRNAFIIIIINVRFRFFILQVLQQGDVSESGKHLLHKYKQTTTIAALFSETLQAFRRKLPIFSVKNHLMTEVSKVSTAIIIGETGSGKTTQIPQVWAGYTQICTHTHRYAHTHKHTHTRTHTRTHARTHTHTHKKT